MKIFRQICSGIIIFLFMGFVVSTVFGTSRDEVAAAIEQANAVTKIGSLQA